jgi:competence protein ComEC
VTVYRTDEDGTVVIQSDGKSLTVNGVAISAQPNAPPGAPDTEKSAAPSTAPTAEPPVVAQPETPGDGVGVDIYITKTGEKYHVAGCESLAKSKIAITLADAKRKGYTPCRICNPPQ